MRAALLIIAAFFLASWLAPPADAREKPHRVVSADGPYAEIPVYHHRPLRHAHRPRS